MASIGHVAGARNCGGCLSTHARNNTMRINKPNAHRSMEWKLKSGGWKSIRPNIARNSSEGATINACSGRKELPIVHASRLPPGIRVSGYAVEAMVIRRFHAKQRKSSCKGFESPSKGSSFLCIRDRAQVRAQTTDHGAR